MKNLILAIIVCGFSISAFAIPDSFSAGYTCLSNNKSKKELRINYKGTYEASTLIIDNGDGGVMTYPVISNMGRNVITFMASPDSSGNHRLKFAIEKSSIREGKLRLSYTDYNCSRN